MATIGLIGYYQGAIRVGFSLVGLLLAAWLCIRLSGVVKPLLPVVGVVHPVLIAFIAPAIVYVLIVVIFKSAAVAVHKKADTHYKYNAGDTERQLWLRLNERLGVCLGLANGAVYFLLVATVAYVLGYATIQVSTSDKDSAAPKILNRTAQEIQSARLDKAVAPFAPAAEFYYDAADILGDIYHNPLLQSRLSSYPVFLTLAEKPQFKSIGNDLAFQEFWQRSPTVSELIQHARIQPLIKDAELYTNVVAMLGRDLQDLKGYLETGKSAKYDDEKILGRWDYDFQESWLRAKKSKPNMGSAELRWAKRTLSGFANATLTAMIDNQLTLKLPSTNNAAAVLKGSWKAESDGKYSLDLNERGKPLTLQVAVEANKLVLSKDGFSLVFEK
jgi:hypothetical protein